MAIDSSKDMVESSSALIGKESVGWGCKRRSGTTPVDYQGVDGILSARIEKEVSMHNSPVSGRNPSSRCDNESWGEKPWKKFEKIGFRLQKRISAARKQGNLKKVNWLPRNLLKSRAALFLAVRKVTQLHAGKRTAGRDGKTALTEMARRELIRRLEREATEWKPLPTSRVRAIALKIHYKSIG